MKSNKAVLGLIAALVVLATVFSAAAPVFGATHDCVGEDCPVCALISACQRITKAVCLFPAAFVAVGAAGISFKAGRSFIVCARSVPSDGRMLC